MDSVVHFEIPAGDMGRAEKFYKSVFGWMINKVPEMDYMMVTTAPTDEKKMMPAMPGSINGGMTKKTDKINAPVITIAVASIDATMKKLEEAGGKVVMPKAPVGDMGFAAYFMDSEGNVMGLWESNPESGM